ncbi:hypothetical protein D3C86_1193530 [compost metagenome]
MGQVALDQELGAGGLAADQRAAQVMACAGQRQRQVADDAVGQRAVQFARNIGDAAVAVAAGAPGAAHRAGRVGVGKAHAIRVHRELAGLLRPADFAAQFVERDARLFEHAREHQRGIGAVHARRALAVIETEIA